MSRTALSVNVRYGRQKVSVAMEPNETVEDLKRNIEKHLGISPTLQRLLFSAPVLREYRQDPSSSITIEKLVDASDEKSDITELNVLVIPKKEGNPIVNSKVTSEYARLVSTTVEHDGNWYRCNYGDGYLLQRAYVCRTCVEEGRADPNHVLCLACADFCHLEHDVEEWGVRYYTRCDCCTERCWRSDTKGADSPNSPPHVVVSNEDILRRTTKRKRSRSSSPITPKSPFRATPEADQDHTSLPPLPPAAPKHNCAFIVDKDTGKPPVSVVLPANRHNRYPRNPLHWCYCLQDVHKDDPDCEGVTCLLCNSCFWSSHLKRLHTRQFSYVPCYGDVLRGETLAFFCETCDTYVCPSCRFRCHKDHQVKDEPVLGCREDGTDNGAPPEAEFTCGCGPLCQAPERVTGSASENWSDPPPSVAEGLMNLDIFTGFICSFCMQEYPWLYENPPDHCYNGSLPEKKPLTQKVIDCGTSSVEENRDRFPFHGMVVPVTFFKEGSTCACAPCQQAFAQFAPRTDKEAENMIMRLHDICDCCNHGDAQFMCQTCELTVANPFLICAECNDVRLKLKEGASPQDVNVAYTHDLSHEFVEDTMENISNMFGIQLLQNSDPETRDYVLQNWEELKNSMTIASSLAEQFGQVPLNYDEQDIKDISALNSKTQKKDPK